MKLPFTIYDLRFTISKKSGRAVSPLIGQSSAHKATRPAVVVFTRHSSPVTRHRESGIALVITLIMLAVTLVMAVAFLALARRESGSVTTTTDTTTARLAAETAVANAQAQIVANMLTGTSNFYNLRLLVSTNYINPAGFSAGGGGNPTNVNYYYANGNFLSAVDLEQNVSNLFFLPRAPVFILTNNQAYDFRYYLDLNQNGGFEANGYQPQVDSSGLYVHTDGTADSTSLVNVQTNFMTGDPEWVGQLEHPDAPHGPNNHFISRYAFIAVPAGNTLDVNYIHNQALNNGAVTLATPDDYMRNQGVGSWEINLAAFLADLNTNTWGQSVGSGASAPAGSALYYQYNQPSGQNFGHAFDDARSLIIWRYYFNSLATANSAFFNTPATTIPASGIDIYGRGPLQTTLNTNEDFYSPVNTALPWSGADNTNHYFTVSDFFDRTKITAPSMNFVDRLTAAGMANSTYDRYTYYRMLDQLGSDSTPDAGKINLNYSNVLVTYKTTKSVSLPATIGVVAGAETNLVPWRPQDFFLAAADQLLRTYTTNWFKSDPTNYLRTYYNYIPAGYVDANGIGVTNIQYFQQTNQIPAFSVTNIPVWVNSNLVYTPAVHRLLQLAANLYDATTNGNYNLPHVYRPVLERVNNNGDIYIVGYVPVTFVSGVNDAQLSAPQDITQLSAVQPNAPILGKSGSPINVYGVPWIIGAKKGLPGFNQLALINSAQITRKMQVSRPSLGMPVNQTNQMYVISISNSVSVSFWNSYATNYYSRSGGPLTIFAADSLYINFTNQTYYAPPAGLRNVNMAYYQTIPSGNYWPGSKSFAAGGSPATASFFQTNWLIEYFPDEIYYPRTGAVVPDSTTPVWDTADALLPLNYQGSLGLATTNYLQAFILDGNNVIDYVQLRGPISYTNLDNALMDPFYTGAQGPLMWSTNLNTRGLAYGMEHQIDVSEGITSAPTDNQWGNGFGSLDATEILEQTTDFKNYFTKDYPSSIPRQAPYTPSRKLYSAYLLQANDPLVHYQASDLNAQVGALAVWAGKAYGTNGFWYQSDDSKTQPLPVTPIIPINGRYQPWRQSGQLTYIPGIIQVTNNYAIKDSLAESSDNWDFPTNKYPTIGWIGRVHRGTPWQTVYLKDDDLIKDYVVNPGNHTNYVGPYTWALWTGDIQRDYFGNYFDAVNSAPTQDRLLFDLFTARLNDNAVRGSLPVNAGAGLLDSGLAAWSALFSGMVVLSNSAPAVTVGSPVVYTNLLNNPAGVNVASSPLWNIVTNISATRANTNLFPFQSFAHAGDILATPALTAKSPFLNLGTAKIPYQQTYDGISDELYEWLPQQMMGLVRASEPRYVIYAYGQTLHPAPGGYVLGGAFFQLVTNYQVAAETAVRAVIRVVPHPTPTGTNYSTVVESYNVLPPY
jgi:hypothetical protein